MNADEYLKWKAEERKANIQFCVFMLIASTLTIGAAYLWFL